MSVKNISYISKSMLQNSDFAAAVKSDIQKTVGNGQFFTVEFYKANGEYRKLNGRLKVTKYLKGTGSPSPDYFHRLKVWDRQIMDYRTIPIDRLISVTMAGKRTEFK